VAPGRSAALRADLLVLTDRPAMPGLEPARPGMQLRITGEVSAFRAALLTERPRVVVVCVPPGSAAEIDLVASERRRRPRLRVVLLDEWDRVGERLDALRLGFDAALPLDLDAGELRGRLALLAEQTREPRATATGCAGRTASNSTSDRESCGATAVYRTCARRNSGCLTSWRGTPAGHSLDASCSIASGTRTVTVITGPWMSMCAGCARSWRSTRSIPACS